MTGKQIVIDLMKKSDMLNCEMAEILNVTQATLWDRLNPKKSDNMRVKTLQEMADVLGYEVAIIPKGTKVAEAYYIGDSYKGERDQEKGTRT